MDSPGLWGGYILVRVESGKQLEYKKSDTVDENAKTVDHFMVRCGTGTKQLYQLTMGGKH